VVTSCDSQSGGVLWFASGFHGGLEEEGVLLARKKKNYVIRLN